MGKIDTVILAAVGGFIAGVLLAPKSGQETRQDLFDKKNEYQAKASESLETIKKGASSIKDELQTSGEAVKSISDNARSNVRSQVNDTAESVKRTNR